MDPFMENKPNRVTQDTLFLEGLCERVKKYENKKKRVKNMTVMVCALLLALIPIYSFNVGSNNYYLTDKSYKEEISQSMMRLQIEIDDKNDNGLPSMISDVSSPCSTSYTCY